MLNPIVHLLMYIGDAILTMLQNNFLTMAPILVEAESDQYKDFDGWAFTGIILAVIGMVVGICLAIPTGGVSLAGTIKCFAIGAAVFAGSGFVFQYAGSEFLDSWDGNFDIPMIQYTPYAIFSGQIPSLDINFINPSETKYDTKTILESERVDSATGSEYGGNSDKREEYKQNYGYYDTGTIIIKDGEKETKRNISSTTTKYTYEWKNSDGTIYTMLYVVDTPERGGDMITTSISFTTPENVSEEVVKEYKSSSGILQSGISTWYRVLRTVALVGLLSVLVYIGIRILFTSAVADKAKYKKMIVDWLVAVCMLFILHYLMVFILTLSTSLTKVVIPKATNNLVVALPKDTTTIGTDNEPLVDYAEKQLLSMPSKYTLQENLIKDENGNPTWIGDYVGYIRLIAGIKNTSTATVYGIMYLVLVIYTCMFTFMYLKRVLYMAFLTMIAPLIALTYPLDKIKDGKAQAFSLWLREYIFNALIQPVHLILYTMLMSTVLNLAVEHTVYALVALGFFTPAERFIRKMFGFESAGTISAFGQIAGGAAVMGAVNKLSKLNKRKKKDEEDGDEGKVRTKEEGGHGLPFGPGDKNVQFGDDGPIPTSNQNNGNTQEQSGANGNSNSNTYDSRLTPEQRDELIAQGIEPGDAEYENALSNYGIRGRDNAEHNTEQNSEQQPHEEDGDSEESSKPRMRSRIYAGMNKVGNHYRKKILKAKPLRTIGKWSGRIIGGAALGTVGLAAGIASGDASKAFSYTAAGAGVGGALGGTVAENAMDEGHELKENFSKGYQGEAQYTNKKLDEEYYNGTGRGESFQDLLEQEDLKGDLKGRERANALREEVQEYRKSGITDNGQISTCMRAGLTPEEGVYAVQISKAMEKSGWNNSKVQKEYEANCRKLLKDNNVSEDRINQIWNTVPKLLF